MVNPYQHYDLPWPSKAGDLRWAIGGFWDEIGDWQYSLIVEAGLKPEHRLLDIGCGSLRGGVKFAQYLLPGRYNGIDLREEFLEAGRLELDALGLSERIPRENLFQTDNFEIPWSEPFDMAVAISLFTHIPGNDIALCFERLQRARRSPDFLFIFTYFEAPEQAPRHLPVEMVRDDGDDVVVAWRTRDPFAYSQGELQFFAGPTWNVSFLGDRGHPRKQFVATASPATS